MSFSFGWRGPSIIKDGLVLYLDAGSPNSYYPLSSGVICKDISGFANNGTLTNGVVYNSQNGGSFLFDGLDDYVTMGNTLNNVLAGTNNKFSLNAWVYRNSNTNQGIIIGKSADSNLSVNQRQIALSFRSLKFDFVYFEKPDLSGYVRLVETTNMFNIQTWHHVCCTYDGSINTNNGLDRVKIYINGVLRTTTLGFVNANPITNTIEGSVAQLSIGAFVSSLNTSFAFFPGNIPHALIYNRVLSASEVLKNYNATKSRFGL